MPDYKIEFQSPSTFDLYELPLEDWHNNINLWADCIHPDDKEEVLRKSNNLFQEGEITQEYRIIKGAYIVKAEEVIKNESGVPVLMTGISADITKRKLAEQQLIENEITQKNLLDSSLELIFSLSKKGDVLFGNKTFHTIIDKLNIKKENIQFKELINQVYLEKFEYHFNLALKNEIVEKLFFSITNSSGNEIYLIGNLVPYILNGEVISVQIKYNLKQN